MPGDSDLERRLNLPDADDTHVLAAAITCSADTLMTLNLRDFPARTLAAFQIVPRHPDAILRLLLEDHQDAIAAVAEQVRSEAERLSGQPQAMRALLKKAGLPRLGKALG